LHNLAIYYIRGDGIHMENCNWPHITSCLVDHAQRFGIFMHNVNLATLQNVIVAGCDQTGIFLSTGSANASLLGCAVEACGQYIGLAQTFAYESDAGATFEDAPTVAKHGQLRIYKSGATTVRSCLFEEFNPVSLQGKMGVSIQESPACIIDGNYFQNGTTGTSCSIRLTGNNDGTYIGTNFHNNVSTLVSTKAGTQYTDNNSKTYFGSQSWTGQTPLVYDVATAHTQVGSDYNAPPTLGSRDDEGWSGVSLDGIMLPQRTTANMGTASSPENQGRLVYVRDAARGRRLQFSGYDDYYHAHVWQTVLAGGLPVYTLGTLPFAAWNESKLIYVSDGASGEKIRYCDGTTWTILG